MIKNILNSKKYILIYILFIFISCLILFNGVNIKNIWFSISISFILIILGSLILTYYNENKNNIKIENLALIIIILFGTCCLFINPILDVCDENEHFARADIQSTGQIIPIYDKTIDRFNATVLTKDLIANWHETIFENDVTNTQINNTPAQVTSAFAQNPSYGYLFSSFGILIAKLLNLTEIWALYLGRFFNLIVYGLLSYASIKKAPKFKMALFLSSCIPLAIYQASSYSIDGLVYGLSFLIISYFLYMAFCDDNKIKIKTILFFYSLILILALMKPNYIIFGILGLLIPNKKLKNNDYILIISCIIISFLITLCWTHYSVDALYMSWRKAYFAGMHVNQTEQINFILHNKKNVLILFSSIVYEIPRLIGELFQLGVDKHSYNSPIISWIYAIFLTVFMVIFPFKTKINKKMRLGLLLIVTIIFVGTYFIQYLTWMSVGSLTFENNGVFTRYFIPLIPLLFLIFNINQEKIKIKNIEIWTILFVISFISSLILIIISHYY